MVTMNGIRTTLYCTPEEAGAEFDAYSEACAATVAFVETALAKKLRRLGDNVEKAVEARNAAIVEAHAEGHSLRSIAKAVGVTHVSILKVIRKADAARQDGE